MATTTMGTATATTATDTATVAETKAPIWRAVFWLLSLANGAALLATRYLPFTDLPEQVASMATIARLMGGERLPYEIAYRSSQYLLYHVAGALLTRVVGDAVTANEILLVAVAVAWPFAFRSLLRSLERDERLALFAPMTLWCRPLQLGFLPFLASVPLSLFGLGLLARALRTRRPAILAGLAVVGVLLFYTHASAYVMFAVIASAWSALHAVAGGRDALRSRIFEAAKTIAMLVPSAIAAIFWWRAGSLTHPGDAVERLPIGATVKALPLWTFDVWRSHVDEFCAGLWWTAVAAIVLVAFVRNRGAQAPLLERLPSVLPFAVAATVYAVTPYRIGAAGMLNVRLAPLIALFALLPLSLGRRRSDDVILGVAAFASLVMTANSAFEIRRVYREKVGDLDALFAPLRPGAKLATLNFHKWSRRTHDWPYVFAGSYYRARGGTIASWTFTELPHWPVHYAAGQAPPMHHPFWSFDPCAYRYVTDGAYYDFVLVQGDVDVFPSDAPGPRFEKVSHAGEFTLYEKRGATTIDGEREGPCPPSNRVPAVY